MFQSKWAIRVDTGERIANLGTVKDKREDGAFVWLAVEGSRWSPITATPVQEITEHYFHATDDLIVEV